MLIPQYSLRWLLGVTAACAVVLSFVALGSQGLAWAAGIATSVVALAILMLVYAALFGGVWICSAVLPSLLRSGKAGKSPFQSANTPPASTDGQETPMTPIILD